MVTAIDMPAIGIAHLFLFFMLYSFVGWVSEEIYCSSIERKLVYRGMLYGPICPIYGFGGIIILYALYPWRTTWVRLFIASMILTSILEYFTSWLLEKLFHAKWWDYSHLAFNLNGRVCLLNSTLFGLGGLALWHFMHPLAEKLIYMPSLQKYVPYIAGGLALVLATDIAFTIRRLVNFTSAMKKLKNFSLQLKEKFGNEDWFKAENMHSMISSVMEKAKNSGEEFNQKISEMIKELKGNEKSVANLFKKFPSMTSIDYRESLDHIKLSLKEYMEEQKRLLKENEETAKEKAKELLGKA